MRIRRLLVAAGAVFAGQITVAPAARAQHLDSVGQARAVCDGAVRDARNRSQHGRTVARGGFLAMLASIPISLSNQSANPRRAPSHTRMEIGHYIGLAGIVAQFTGGAIAGTGGVSSSEWDDALQRLTIGKATAAEVEICLGKPTSRTSEVVVNSGTANAPAETSWEYRARIRKALFRGSYSRIVTIAFRDSVVSGIKVTETR
jgi:hypothetical protein